MTSGQFCQTGTNYTLHFVARFDRAFASAGTWDTAGPHPGASSCTGTSCGAFTTFDTRATAQVLMKVGISFVSTRDAAAEPGRRGPRLVASAVAAQARERWNALLGPHRRRWRHRNPTARLLHRPLPLAPVPQRRLRRQRRLRGERRPGAHRPRPGGVRRLLRVGHLPQRSPARVPARPSRRGRHDPVARRRRRAGRVAPEVGHCRRRRVPNERGLGRPHHRGRLRHGRAQLRRRRRRALHGQGGLRRPRRTTGSRSSAST